ncbi:MAG: hypothetical protein J0L74_08625 [Burkholderiales bacterium]|nr:hypothetical protein [Burkholderiales bacterium]
MIDANAFTKLVPGFDFLQGLMNTAGQAMPAMGQWVAPTLDPAELDKRIGELKTVQFWLEQNARMIATTIQALEVQRMTLATLQTMNLPVTDLRQAMTLPDKPAKSPARAPAPAGTKRADAAAGEPPKPAGVDPMQWWGALTQQFQQIAANAVREAARAAPELPKADTAPPAAPGSAKAAARKSTSAKKAPARKPDRKPATKKTAARAAKAASDPTPPAAEARGATLGWPLPPPFKLGR